MKLFCRGLCLTRLVSTWIKSAVRSEVRMKMYKSCSVFLFVFFFTSTRPFLLSRKIGVSVLVTIAAVVCSLSACLFLL